MTVLVLDGHSRAAMETLQSLGRAGIEVDIAAETADCLAFHSRYASRKLRQPPQNQLLDFHNWLQSEDCERNYELIVPATEASLLGLRALNEGNPLRRKAVLASDQSLDIALDKEKTCALAQSLSIPVPQSRLITSLSEIGSAAPFPLVLKPVHSKLMVAGELRTLAVAVISDEAQRQEQLRRWLSLTPVLQQQYVGGRGVGAEFLFNHGQKVWHFVHERLHEYPLSGGASSYRRAIQPPPELLHDAERLLNALNWHGVAMVEFKMDGRGQYWLMEINPRLWGSLAVSIDAGVDFPRGLLKVARGEHPCAQPDYRLVYTRDFRTDLEWLKANLTADPQDRLLLTRSRTLSFVELLRPLTGREKWDHFDWRDLGVTRRLLAAAFTDQARPVFRRIRDWRVRRRWLQHHRAVLSQLAHSGGVKKIVFLCYGNICRSPLAAGLAQQSLPQVEIVSAGFHPQSERNCPEKMLRIAQSFNLDLSHHRSARITREQLLTADLVVAMDLENIGRLKAEFPEALSRTTLLGLFSHPARVAIADPYNADESTTGKICDRVRSGIKGLVQSIPASQAVLSSAELPPAVQSAR